MRTLIAAAVIALSLGGILCYYLVQTQNSQSESTLKGPDALDAKALDANSQDQFSLAKKYVWSGNPPLIQKGVKILENLANRGDAQSMRLMGMAYLGVPFKGSLIVPTNPSRAIAWLSGAANGGDEIARLFLIETYETGRGGIPRNPDKANEWRWIKKKGVADSTSAEIHAIQPNDIPRACLPRTDFPEAVRQDLPAEDLYSGLQTDVMSSPNCSIPFHKCFAYSKSDYERLWNVKLIGFAPDIFFGIHPCPLGQDTAERLRRATADAQNFEAPQGIGQGQNWDEIIGTWCGRNQNDGYVGEIRITFSRKGSLFTGHAVTTWPRILGGPLGEEGYVSNLDLFPKRGDSSTDTVLRFSEVSKHRTGDRWSLDPQTHKLAGYIGNPYTLTRSCEGFWQGPEPQ